MILSYILPILLSFTPNTYNVNKFYKYHGDLHSDMLVPSLSIPADSNKSYYIETTVQLDVSMSYDDSDNWYLSRFTFGCTANAYYLDNYNTLVLDRTVTLTVKPYNWNFTPSSYLQQLSNTTFKVGLDSVTDTIYIDFLYSGDDYNEPITDHAVSLPLDDSWDNYPSSNITIHFDNTTFFNQVNYYSRLSTDEAYDNAYQDGYSHGYTDGFNHGVEVDDTAVTILNGILNIALVPINFFLGIFNFEILGINVSQLVSALLSICLVIIVVRMVTGKSQGGGE